MMLTSRISVDRQTDIAEEVAALERFAIQCGLETAHVFTLTRQTEMVLADLKTHASETKRFGIAINLTRTVVGPGYKVQLSLAQGATAPSKGRRLWAWITGRS